MSVRNLARATIKDLKRWARDPFGIVLWAAIPLAIALIMKLAFGGGDLAPQAKLVIADQDQTPVTGLLKGAFSQGPLADLFQVAEADSIEAMATVENGRVSSALFIPKGFTEAYLEGERPRLRLAGFHWPARRDLCHLRTTAPQR